jgi:hypothetical protein
MRRVRLAFACFAAAPALVPTLPARAAAPTFLWATINVCDSPAHPDQIGVRASMPGDGDAGDDLYMRFRLQYLSSDERQWVDVGPTGDSGWIRVGPGKVRSGQAGTTFMLAPPPSGTELLRAVASFQWRNGTAVERRARRYTALGHPNTKGADPVTFTAATCRLGTSG